MPCALPLLASSGVDPRRPRLDAFEDAVAERGLSMRSLRQRRPFASPMLFNLSKLSVWWLRLGTPIERIELGLPQQTPSRAHARHLEVETTRPPG